MRGPVSLSAYAESIHLLEPFDRPSFSYVDDSTRYTEFNALLSEIKKENSRAVRAAATPQNQELTYVCIRSFLNVRPPIPVSEPMQTLLDHYLLDFQSRIPITKLSSISTLSQDFPTLTIPHSAEFSLWIGDITRLEVDAIVNACNEQMLGCFSPMHTCIDNCIHTFASPRLRHDMGIIMDMQQCFEPTGIAKVTRAYLLPSRFVLHTVGPIFGQQSEQESVKLLAASYTNCLDLAVEVGARSVAFCCLSTGVFGFPNELASVVAVKTCAEWLDGHPGTMDRIVFNCFSEKDAAFYRKVFGTVAECI
jgi:O-acetyl-ADP-ribose deacetylase (regulator of RNase III)